MHATGTESQVASDNLDAVYVAFRTVRPATHEQTSFYDDAVRQLNSALTSRRDRLRAAAGGLPQPITILILFSSIVIVAYAWSSDRRTSGSMLSAPSRSRPSSRYRWSCSST
jgi:hypothetical protein